MKKIIISVLFILCHWLVMAQVPGTLSYQGILVGENGLPVADGSHTVTFNFYNVETGGIPVFSRGKFTITTYKGLFTFLIGSGLPANNTPLSTNAADNDYIGNGQFYVSVVADDVELSPRVQLSTVPYALQAQNANSVTNGAITAAKIASGAVTSAKIADGTIEEADLASNAVTSAKIAADAVTSAKIADGAILAADLASNAVTSAKIAADAVTSAKIADLTISEADLATNAVTSAKIADGAILAVDLASNAVSSAKIAADAVTSAKIADGTIVNADIANGTISDTKLAAISTAGKVSGSAITSGTIGGSTVMNTSGNIITSGNIGIGRTSPAAKLDVNGQMILNADNSWVTGGIRFRNSTGSVDGAIVQGMNGAMNYRAPNSDGAAGHIFLSGGGSSNLMVIRNNGNIGIGTTSPTNRLSVVGGIDQSGGNTTFNNSLSNAQGNMGIGTGGFSNAKLYIKSDQDYTAYIEQTVSTKFAIYALGKVGGTNGWFIVSDVRYKKNIEPLTNSISKVSQLEGVKYDFRTDEFEQLRFNESRQIGLIAQQVRDILPEVVSEDAQGYLSVDYSSIVPVLIEAIKEQQQHIEKLKDELNALRSKHEATQSVNSTLEAKVNSMENDLKDIKKILMAKDL